MATTVCVPTSLSPPWKNHKMNLIKFSILKPVTVIVGMLLLILFGVIGFRQLPVQLTPDVERPQITVRTVWTGATPYEVEKDVVEAQEKVLKGIQGLTMLESSSYNNLGEITLTFAVGTDIDAALLRVSNKLNEVPRYPQNVEKPVIDPSGAQNSPVMWMVLKTATGDPARVKTFRTFFENDVRQYLDRVPGVGSLFVFGGSEQQLEIVVSPEKLAKHQLTIADIINRLAVTNTDVSAGVLGLEKKNYRIRTLSQFQSLDDPLALPVIDDGIRRVFLGDVAETRLGYASSDVSVMSNGTPVIVIGVRKEQGANVVELTQQVREVVAYLNEGPLKSEQLFIDIVYEETPYIKRAINLVKRNVLIGGMLAIGVLLIFLRSITSTLVTAVAIPVSVIGTFIFLWLFDRSLNVVTLTGVSFAVGMLVDNAIVSLENIDRHRQMGKSPFDAAHDGSREIWGAVFASTATTVAVFLPIIFTQQEASQLFKDIAIAISFAIPISLILSVTAIPMMTYQFYKRRKNSKKRLVFVANIGTAIANGLLALCRMALKNWATRIATVAFFTAASVITVAVLMPKAEYLPQGNRNLILNILVPPPGYSLEKREQIGEFIYKSSQPYFEEDYKDGIPQIRSMFYVSADRISLFGALSHHETEARDMIPLFTRIIHSIPGMFGISIQAGIFQSGLGRGRTVAVDVSGEDIDRIVAVARTLFGTIQQKMPQAQVRPIPSLEISYPEANFIPTEAASLANGFSEVEIGQAVDVLMDGRIVGEFKPGQQKKIDLVLRADGGEIQVPEDIANSTVANRYGNLVRVKDVAELHYDQGMTQIDHLERRRNIKLEVTPPQEMALQEALEFIETDIVAGLREAGQLEGTLVSVGGNADNLLEAMQSIKWNLVLAALIVYLLMASLFENFFYPFIIMFTVPLAAAGGFIGLSLVNLFVAPQPFDIVTMLGFIILVGTVVNNAILIVHQALNNVRYGGFVGVEAVIESVRTRIRPIFMSTTTSLFGMLPLVLSTGPGSELYLGLGSVIQGRLAISTLFTLFVIPSLLAFFIGFEKPEHMGGPA